MQDFSPFEEMVKLFRSTTKERIKVDILTELCSYIAPKLKSVELSGDNDNPFVINLQLAPGKERKPTPIAENPVVLIEGTTVDDDEDEGT